MFFHSSIFGLEFFTENWNFYFTSSSSWGETNAALGETFNDKEEIDLVLILINLVALGPLRYNNFA